MEFPPPPRFHVDVPAYAPAAPQRRSAPFAMVGVMVVLALLAVALFALAGGDDRSAEDRLDSAQSFAVDRAALQLGAGGGF